MEKLPTPDPIDSPETGDTPIGCIDPASEVGQAIQETIKEIRDGQQAESKARDDYEPQHTTSRPRVNRMREPAEAKLHERRIQVRRVHALNGLVDLFRAGRQPE